MTLLPSALSATELSSATAEPLGAEAGPDRGQLVRVEGEQHDHEDRQVQEGVDEEGLEAEDAVHEPVHAFRGDQGPAAPGSRRRAGRGGGHASGRVTGR